MASKKTTKMIPLTGQVLLSKIKTIPHLSKREKAKECGYETTEGSRTKTNLSQFMNAILEAKGVSLDADSEKVGRGKKAEYKATVHTNGQIVLGSAYTQEMKLKAGDEFEIHLGRKHIKLKLIS